MTSGNAIRGSRVGAGPMGDSERGEAAPRIRVSFWCVNRHETRPAFAADAEIPETWECPRCGNPAGPNEQDPPAPPQAEPFKTHLAYLKERRSDSDGEAILAAALARLHNATSPPPAASTADGEGQGSPGRRGRRAGSRLPETVSASAPPAATKHGHDTQHPPEPAGRRGPARRGTSQAGRNRGGPARPADEGPRAAGHAARAARPDSGPDLAAGEAEVAAESLPTPAGGKPGRAEPAPSEAPTGKWCGKCQYRVGSPSHRRICLGQW